VTKRLPCPAAPGPWHAGFGRRLGETLWVPKTMSPHTTCAYSWISPPSRPRLEMRVLPVGADNAFTSCDLRILVEEAAEPVASSDADVVVCGRDVGPAVGWLLAEGPVRAMPVVATRGHTW